jgi:hypothetical protein
MGIFLDGYLTVIAERRGTFTKRSQALGDVYTCPVLPMNRRIRFRA